jgi:hypothetical protein
MEVFSNSNSATQLVRHGLTLGKLPLSIFLEWATAYQAVLSLLNKIMDQTCRAINLFYFMRMTQNETFKRI